MKTFFTILLLFFLAISLCSCPYSSPYKLDDNPYINVDDLFLGKWATFINKEGAGKEEPIKLILSKKTETEYNIVLTGYLDELKSFDVMKSDSVKGTAFMSEIGDKQFLNITIKTRVYIAELKYKEDKLSLLPLVEHFTSKMIFNNTALRNSVAFHYKTRLHPMYDDSFCLKDMVRVN